ncbi:glycosyltransferase family 4 protein [Flavobacterium solisilvae]|uniref:Glycosyltransferase family 4 protein n=1 Tax=Flavobacterium solisilvae TaxID=1852019 RepID=A0ABX1QSQ5_9FLAO|nr:glycosyltransferase family 4 protein [Flavobacterium solisilvae]NMH25322.1 glycosyltransferase family 4 protein [Flavobacterium solisilvae]
MSKKVKIAIYSGEIPSTVFIERLILGMSKNDYLVYLFGYQKRKVNYQSKSIFVKSYSDNRFFKFLLLIKYSVLLFLFNRKDKKTLDIFINQNTKNKTLSKIKYYPVLWYKPDVFHIQWAKSISDWYWVQQFGIKLVVSFRGVHINYSPIFDPKLAEIYRKYFPQVDGFHAVSKAISLEAQKYGAVAEKIKVVYSGLSEIKNDNPREENEGGEFKIISVGRNHWVKGYTYSIDAVKILVSHGVNVKYTIIGGQNSEELLFKIKNYQLENNVVLLGNIPFSEVQKMMNNSDLLLLPSVEEGIANVVLEAMQLGTLVLSTDCGGMNEVIQHKKNGFIVPVRNSQKIADAVLEIMKLTENEKNNIISNAKETINKNHTEDKMINDMISLYKTVLNQ